MLRIALRRILAFIPLLIGVAFVTYLLSFYGPGDPLRIIMGENWSSEEVYQNLRKQYGLDRPLLVQFGDYLWHAVHGDFGRSYIQRVSVGELVGKALPVSAQLALVATVIVAVVGIGLGVVAALWHYRWPDALIGLFGVVTHSIPAFVRPGSRCTKSLLPPSAYSKTSISICRPLTSVKTASMMPSISM